MHTLTRRQSEVLDFIKNAIAHDGMPPTVAEITLGLGLNSTNGVRGHLQALARKGAIELIPNASRGIRVPRQGVVDDRQGLGNESGNSLPVVGRVAAGFPILAEQHIEDYYRIDSDIFRPKADYLLSVKGMSMRDIGIFDGDMVAVHQSKHAENGQVVVARLDDEVTVKRLKKTKNVAYLIAENPDYEAIRVDFRRQHMEIEGIVVGVIKYM